MRFIGSILHKKNLDGDKGLEREREREREEYYDYIGLKEDRDLPCVSLYLIIDSIPLLIKYTRVLVPHKYDKYILACMYWKTYYFINSASS